MVASVDASAAVATSVDEDVAENIGGGATSVGARSEGEHSTASANLGSDDFVRTALEGIGGPTAEPSAVAPMPGVLGDKSSDSEGEDVGGGDDSLLEMRRLTTWVYAVLLLFRPSRCLRMRRRQNLLRPCSRT